MTDSSSPPVSDKPDFVSKQVLEGRYAFFDLALQSAGALKDHAGADSEVGEVGGGGVSREVSEFDPRDADGLTVVAAGWESCDPSFDIKRDGFQWYTIEWVASGTGEFWANGKRYILRPGVVFAYGPGVSHRLRTLGGPLVKTFVTVTGPKAQALMQEAGVLEFNSAGESESASEQSGVGDGVSMKSVVKWVESNRWMRELFEQLLETARVEKPYAQRLAKELFSVLVTRLMISSRPIDEAHEPTWVAYSRCRRLIEKEYLTISSAQAAAEALSISSAYLCRLFQKHGQQTPYRFLMRLKMDHAADLLVREGLSVKQAAREVGIDDPFQFSRAFKRVYQLSPTAFVNLVGASNQDG